MKLKKRILLPGVFLILITATLFIGRDYIFHNEKIKNLILEEIGEKFGENLNIAELTTHFGYVNFKGVKFNFENGNDFFTVEELGIGWSLLDLLKNKFTPTQGITEIKLIRPELVISNTKGNIDKAEEIHSFYRKRDQLLTQIEATYKTLFANFKNISRIQISDGIVNFKTASGEMMTIAQDLDGSFETNDKIYALINLESRLFNSSEKNLEITANSYLPEFDFTSEILINGYDLKSDFPQILTDALLFTDGKIDAKLNVDRTSEGRTQNKYSVTGDFQISNGSYTLSEIDLKFTDVNTFGKIHNDMIEIRELTSKCSNAKMNVFGSLDNLLDPELNLTMAVTGMNLNSLKSDSLIRTDRILNGDVSGTLTLKGYHKDPVLSGSLFSDEILIDDMVFTNISTEVTLEYPKLSFKDTKTNFNDTEIKFDYDTDLKNLNSVFVSGDIKGNLLTLQDYIHFPDDNDYSGDINFLLNRKENDFEGFGSLNITSSNEKGDLVYQGDFTVYNKEVLLKGESADGVLSFNGTLNYDNSEFDIKIDNAFPALTHDLDYPVQKITGEDVLLNMDVNGNEHRTNIFISALTGQGDTLATIDGDYIITALGQGYLQTQLNMPISDKENFSVNVELSRDDKSFKFDNIYSPDLFTGYGEVESDDEMKINAKINIETDIKRLNRFFDESFLDAGVIRGEIDISGNYDFPEIQGNLSLINAARDSIFNLNGEALFDSDNWKKFRINDISMSQGDLNLARGTGGLDVSALTGKIDIEGINVPLQTISSFFVSDNRELCSGEVSYKLNYLKNEFGNYLTGNVEIPSGKIERYNIENFSLSLNYPDIPENTEDNPEQYSSPGYIPQGVWVDNISFNTLSDLRTSGSGFISLDDASESDFNLKLEGNILSLFSDSWDYFQSTSSLGNINMILNGTLFNPYINSGSVSLANGEMEFKSVFEKIENINLTAELEAGSRFINLIQAEAELDGKPVNIENEYQGEITTESGEMQTMIPFDIMDDGLNLGIFKIFTTEEGVEPHITEVLYGKNRCNIRLYGRNEDEAFYLAGPKENPRIRGNAIIKDSRIHYPVLTTGEYVKPNVVQRFLTRADWDVILIPESNNFYTKKVPNSLIPIFRGLAGDLFINVKIDDEEEGLRFIGSLDEDAPTEFAVVGDLKSSRGQLETLDFVFKVENSELFFNQGWPYLRGIAKTKVRDPQVSSPIPGMDNNNKSLVDIYLILVSETFDSNGQNTGKLLDYGTWDENYEPEFYFQLSAEPNISGFSVPVTSTSSRMQDLNSKRTHLTDERLLMLLGISTDNIGNKAASMMVARGEQMLLDPVLQPVNRTIQRTFGLDEFRIRPNISKAFSYQKYDPRLFNQAIGSDGMDVMNPKYLFLSPELSIGKYILDDLYFNYQGQIVRTISGGNQDDMGFSHLLGLEYRLKNQVYIEFEWDYDYYRFLNKGDARLWFRHQVQLKGLDKNKKEKK
ncbi:MAG: hypothetical protein GY863_03750 [bacterium]|nr:hypothetical protein [bacterium]